MSEEFTPMQSAKILFLEDDVAFKDAITDFLESQFYAVTGVPSGVEGVREIMANDFDVIVCDMMMPSLPGDMFYYAVERMRPYLCARFIFITGAKGDKKIHEFIRKVNGTILMKPFHVQDLLETIRFVQSKTSGLPSR
ncbi:MAG: response regulator [Verrucomicrobiota bacterium]|nr:response regulator [Verrucomicrobiota bacterium]